MRPSGRAPDQMRELTFEPGFTRHAEGSWQRGTRVREAGPVTFTVRQESISQPPVGPILRPPPKPQPHAGAANKLPTTQPSYGALNGGLPAVNPATNLPVAKSKPKPKKP